MPKYKIFWQKICVYQKKAVPLHPLLQLTAKFLASKLPANFATLAQLVEQRIRNA